MEAWFGVKKVLIKIMCIFIDCKYLCETTILVTLFMEKEKESWAAALHSKYNKKGRNRNK